jgi:hypothetical protein
MMSADIKLAREVWVGEEAERERERCMIFGVGLLIKC